MGDSNVPIGAVVFILITLFLKLKDGGTPERRLPIKDKLKRMDPLGAILVIASVCCLLLALQWGGTTISWRSKTVIGLLIGFGLLLVAFGLVQWWNGEKATIPLRIMWQRSVFMGAWYHFFLEMSIYIVSNPFPWIDLALRSIGHLLHPILLPSCAGRGCHYEWSSLNSTWYSSDFSCRCCRCVGNKIWTLCIVTWKSLIGLS